MTHHRMFNRRRFLSLLGFMGLGGCRYWPDHGLLNPCFPDPELPEALARHELIRAAWEGIDTGHWWDGHVHLLGNGDSGSGAWVNPRLQSPLHPVEFLQYGFYKNAACVADAKGLDRAYVARLRAYMEALPEGARLLLLAFDYHHGEDGQPRHQLSPLYVPNTYAAALHAALPQHFEWAASIHPYRPDAVFALQQAAMQGARAVKWLPAVMGMDPASPRCDDFYQALAALNIPLLCHAGAEWAVSNSAGRALGNPLKLRRALDHGVRVIVAHCASLGSDVDTDRGVYGPELPSFQLFARLMDEARYHGQVYGDISALTQINREPDILRSLLTREDWHSRLLNGSDYPLPGVLPLYSVRGLASSGLISQAEVEVLATIRLYNPLLGDFILKRRLEYRGRRFSSSVFETRNKFLAKAG